MALLYYKIVPIMLFSNVVQFFKENFKITPHMSKCTFLSFKKQFYLIKVLVKEFNVYLSVYTKSTNYLYNFDLILVHTFIYFIYN